MSDVLERLSATIAAAEASGVDSMGFVRVTLDVLKEAKERIEAQQPVVDAAIAWRHADSTDLYEVQAVLSPLLEAIDAYQKEKQ